MAAQSNDIFSVSVTSDFQEWWRYNIFLIVETFDDSGQRLEYLKTCDTVYEIGNGNEIRTPPSDYNPARPISITTPPCDHIAIYLYVVPNTFPASTVIRNSPDFMVTLHVTHNGKLIQETDYPVNQWGGVTLAGIEVSGI